MKTRADRSTVLSEGSALLGAQWALSWFEEMWRTGRPVAGGWPGTLPEARARVVAHFGSELARLDMLQLNPEELARATRSTYDKAKSDWLRAMRDRARSGVDLED